MRILAVALILVFCWLPSLNNKGCECVTAKSDETTRWGGNHWITGKEQGTFKTIHGTVAAFADDSGIDDALVEIFDQPDYILCDWQPNNPNRCTNEPPLNQRRIAACKTGKDGKFCFKFLPSGRYELRVSKDSSWNVVHIYVAVESKSLNSTNRGIRVEMTVGD